MLLQTCLRSLLLSGCIIFSFFPATSQHQEPQNLTGLTDKLFKAINKKTDNITDQLSNQMAKCLNRLAKEEKRLKIKLASQDSAAAAKIFDEAEKQYADWQKIISTVDGKISILKNSHNAHLDTLQTAFRFLDKTEGLLMNTSLTKSSLKEAMANINLLQDKFNQAEQIKNYLKLRRQNLKDQLSRYGLTKKMARLEKQVYYYQARVNEYKTMINDPSALVAKLIEILKQTEVFRDFFNKHSQLAGLFRLPDNTSSNTMASLAGLQTRNAIQQDLAQRFGSAQQIQSMMQQQVHHARNQLDHLKNKINQIGGGSGDQEMPDFKPNNQRTKRIKDRLEFGTNLQTVRTTRFFPSTTDIGLSIGYKLNDKSIVGVGSSYKFGWGRSIRHLSITHEGVGMRSFLDYKVKGNFWLTAGAEMNYRSRFHDFAVFKDYSAWQRAALIGVSKKYQVMKKVKGNMQLMHDLLYKVQVPRGQAVIFRIGYNF
ncbi:MAG: hypothetical protein WKF97_22335 [Chitinophagaceae bacterium]